MTDIAIKVENLSKRYRIGLEEKQHDTLISAALSWLKSPVDNFRTLRKLSTFNENGHEPDDVIWALKDVSFEVKRGEVVGIIGRNGAGKSTLLKILSRITAPTSGRVILNGRVASLLEVGTGFHPELTGRENIYLNGTVLGMTRTEVDRKFDEIVDFSGVEKFIDTPVKRYSSGMRVRLAFSVAAHLEPEILLVDEVLAVGDVSFQKKCLGKMGEVAKEGRTVLFVSHNMGSIDRLTNRAIWIDNSQIREDGSSSVIINNYLNCFDNTPVVKTNVSSHASIINSINFKQHGRPINAVGMGEPVTIEVSIDAPEALEQPYIGLGIDHIQFGRVLSLSNRLTGRESIPEVVQTGIFKCEIDALPLNSGTYLVSIFLWDGHSNEVERVERACSLHVVVSEVYDTGAVPKAGIVFVPHTWDFCE